jgi:hypothetical protein
VHNKKLTKISYKTPSGVMIFKLYDDDVGEITPVTEYLQVQFPLPVPLLVTIEV